MTIIATLLAVVALFWAFTKLEAWLSERGGDDDDVL